LINPGCEIGHANASTNCSNRLSFSVSALDFFPAKSTMVGIFIILVIQTLRISPYLPSSLNSGTSITSAISIILHHTSIHVLLYGGFQGFHTLWRLSRLQDWFGLIVEESCHKVLDSPQLTTEVSILWIPFPTFKLLMHSLRGMDDG
jgi:hypothetical protein